MHPDIIPGRYCTTCGSQLWAYPMDVGYVEVICHECDNRRDVDEGGDE